VEENFTLVFVAYEQDNALGWNDKSESSGG
jgi:hypothetical protein